MHFLSQNKTGYTQEVADAAATAKLAEHVADALAHDGTYVPIAETGKADPGKLPSGWTLVPKVSGEDRDSTTTPAIDLKLWFAMAANATYMVRGVVHYSTPLTAGFQWGFSGPASPDSVSIVRMATVGGVVDSADTDVAYKTDISTVSATSVNGAVSWSGVIKNGATPGNFGLWWAQSVSNASATTVKAGSYLEWVLI